jgi:predicted GIY-YIG superfamily endonuclease
MQTNIKSSITRKESSFILVNPDTINTTIDPQIPRINRFYEPPKAYWLYALRLEDDRYYVGFTGKKNPYDRIMQHVSGPDGAKWTGLYKPVEVMEIRDAGTITLTQVKTLEQNLTAAYMNIYGTNRVRGGIFNYPGQIFNFGKNRVIMGYELLSLIVGVLLILESVYIFLRHCFNWW